MSICPCNCKYHRSIDIKTPRMVPLSAFFKRSFAFHSVRERFPLVIKRIMEDLMKRRDDLAKKYGEPVREELKKTVDELAALKYELQSNKELTPIISDDADVAVFNDYLQRRKAEDGHTSPYSTSILYAEAYLYRRLRTIFEKQKILKDYDCFKKFKEDAFEDAIPIMRELAIHMEEGCECISDKDAVFDLMKITLWANKYDLSINKGVEFGIHLNMARKLEPNVVCDHSEAIWEAFRSNRDNDSIAYVPNNAGYELFCDLCLADMLTTKGLTSHVTFHSKTIPSYVSDVTKNDINWMIDTMKNHSDPHLRCLGQRWNDYLASKIWEIDDDPFWHYPLDYTYMQEYAPALHAKLASANLIIFKGDLAYRKLFGDINWDPNTPVDKGLRGFLPAKLCVLRTIKYGVVCGIAEDVADKCLRADHNWKESGNYGVIQYCDTIYVEPPQEEMVFPPDPGAEGVEGYGGPRETIEEPSFIDEEGPQPEVEGGGDLGQAEESGRGRETVGTDVAGVVAGLVGHTAQQVDGRDESRPGSAGVDQGSGPGYREGQTSDASAQKSAQTDHTKEQYEQPTTDTEKAHPSTGKADEDDLRKGEDQLASDRDGLESGSTVEDRSTKGDNLVKEDEDDLQQDEEKIMAESAGQKLENAVKDRSVRSDNIATAEDQENKDRHVKIDDEASEVNEYERDEDRDQLEEDKYDKETAEVDYEGLQDEKVANDDMNRAHASNESGTQDISKDHENYEENEDHHEGYEDDNISDYDMKDGQKVPKEHKKYEPPKNEKWDRYKHRLEKIRKEKGAHEHDEKTKPISGSKPQNKTAVAGETKPGIKNAEKSRVPESPSELSVEEPPNVDGEEVPE